MGIRMTTPIDDINKAIQSELERIDKIVIRALSYLGELCVTEARDRPQDISWIDHTGNLRSSIGYVIVKKGVIVKYSEFTHVKGGVDGSNEGKKFAETLAKQFVEDYVLVVVAGMNYAEYVEAIENKNVLASTELYATKNLPIIMRKLRRQIAS